MNQSRNLIVCYSYQFGTACITPEFGFGQSGPAAATRLGRTRKIIPIAARLGKREAFFCCGAVEPSQELHQILEVASIRRVG